MHQYFNDVLFYYVFNRPWTFEDFSHNQIHIHVIYDDTDRPDRFGLN